jgi:outer membrane protein OmpA-like peptidoglycan-associated protein
MNRILLTVVLLAAPGLAPAQDLTDAQLLDLFRQQRDAFGAAASGDIGATRGLRLIDVDDLQPDTVEAMTAPEAGGGATVTETATGTTPSRDGNPVADAAPQVVTVGVLPTDIQVNQRIEFAFNSAALDDSQKPALDQLCRVMKASDINLFRIIGHTDAAGSDAYNERLSLLRAKEVQRYFINDCGIAGTRLEAVGMGERFLNNSSDPNASENRRVEFQAMS